MRINNINKAALAVGMLAAAGVIFAAADATFSLSSTIYDNASVTVEHNLEFQAQQIPTAPTQYTVDPESVNAAKFKISGGALKQVKIKLVGIDSSTSFIELDETTGTKTHKLKIDNFKFKNSTGTFSDLIDLDASGSATEPLGATENLDPTTTPPGSYSGSATVNVIYP